MRRKEDHIAHVVALVIFLVVVMLFALLRSSVVNNPAEDPVLGATFSSFYAKDLGLDWRNVYIAVLDDLKVKNIRIPIYWSEVQPTEDEIDWSQVDWMLEEADRRGVNVTLAIGRKVPRWPECFIPDWVEEKHPMYQSREVLNFVEKTVDRFKDWDVVVRWQVENEPFFPFGVCPQPDLKLFKKELEIVRKMSDKPIMLTASGEVDTWIDTAIPADILGVSMYRSTWNDLYGYFVYPFGPNFYRAKAFTVRSLVNKSVISELQAEPWFTTAPQELSVEEHAKLFTSDKLNENVNFAIESGFDEIYLWGVEWWYYLKVNNQSAMWEAGKELFRSPQGI